MSATLTEEYIALYKRIAESLKTQQDMFLLGKGFGFLAANYTSQKFMQIAGIHAEAYPSGEFRHGPLSMIDDVAKTPGKWSRLVCFRSRCKCPRISYFSFVC